MICRGKCVSTVIIKRSVERINELINSRQKGARAERELANVLKKYGYETRRGQQYSGANGDADVVGLDKIHIECKRVERLNIDDAVAQSVRDARQCETPVVMHRKNHQPWLVTMRLDDWIKFYKEWSESDEQV